MSRTIRVTIAHWLSFLKMFSMFSCFPDYIWSNNLVVASSCYHQHNEYNHQLNKPILIVTSLVERKEDKWRCKCYRKHICFIFSLLFKCKTQFNGCTTQFNGCTTQFNGCTTQFNVSITQFNVCTTQFYVCTTYFNVCTT